MHPTERSFYAPNLLTNAMKQRQCGTCRTVGLIPVPFGVGCPNCGVVQVVSGQAVLFDSLPMGEEFYAVGHVSQPYVVWVKTLSIITATNGAKMAMNARADVQDQSLFACFLGSTFVVRAKGALMADRFSFN